MINMSGSQSRRMTCGCIAFAAVTFSINGAAAQPYPREVITHCANIAWNYPAHHCSTCDTFLYAIELACQANGGRLPGPLTVFGDRPYDYGPTWQDRAAQ
jgi:hypothetical protein